MILSSIRRLKSTKSILVLLKWLTTFLVTHNGQICDDMMQPMMQPVRKCALLYHDYNHLLLSVFSQWCIVSPSAHILTGHPCVLHAAHAHSLRLKSNLFWIAYGTLSLSFSLRDLTWILTAWLGWLECDFGMWFCLKVTINKMTINHCLVHYDNSNVEVSRLV